MEEFKIIKPSLLLAPYIKNYWLLKTACDSPKLARTHPIGMMSLIFHRGNRLLSVHDNMLHPRAFLSGHEKSFADLEYVGQISMISVVFRPAGVKAFFDFPMSTISNLRVTAGDIEDKEFAGLEHSLMSTEDDQLCIYLIERFLLNRLCHLDKYNLKRIDATIQLINSGYTEVGFLADKACLSPKQFQRIFSEYVGMNPKEFARVVRFQRALHKLESSSQISFTALAAECNYFDQSHMIKDFRALSGYTPSEYLDACSPHSDYFN